MVILHIHTYICMYMFVYVIGITAHLPFAICICIVISKALHIFAFSCRRDQCISSITNLSHYVGVCVRGNMHICTSTLTYIHTLTHTKYTKRQLKVYGNSLRAKVYGEFCLVRTTNFTYKRRSPGRFPPHLR